MTTSSSLTSSSPPPQIAPDDLCPICHLLLFNPVRTSCNHLLCSSCMSRWASASQPQLTSSPISDFDPNYSLDDTDGFENLVANCPMCRTRTTGNRDEELSEALRERYASVWEERRVDEEARVAWNGHVVEGDEVIMLLLGNEHRSIREGALRSSDGRNWNKHHWCFFVRVSKEEIVSEVRVRLHRTFRDPNITLAAPPFEVSQRGWGMFNIEAWIVLKEPYRWVVEGNNDVELSNEMKLNWMLSFTGRGKQGRIRAKVRKVESTDVSGFAEMQLGEESEEGDGDYEYGGEEEESSSSSSEEEEEDGEEGRMSPVRWPHMERGDV